MLGIMLALMVLQAMGTIEGQVRPIDLGVGGIRKLCSLEPARVGDGEIVVCGRRDAARRYRLQPLDTARFEPRRPAEIGLVGDLKGMAEVERKELAPGMTSSRVMVRLKLPF